ncbi:hypothetical protein EVAR_64945_1 [Eumeta japonica]|uniref:Uncharacterized protein n=1 Tax=Eumeta variegata TaxID=151549 RepID=A0A4C1Z9K5_EUMVA|nr:hypothetical protein EVAR_64945_1 [Eumeta japonica]
MFRNSRRDAAAAARAAELIGHGALFCFSRYFPLGFRFCRPPQPDRKKYERIDYCTGLGGNMRGGFVSKRRLTKEKKKERKKCHINIPPHGRLSVSCRGRPRVARVCRHMRRGGFELFLLS